LEKNGGAYGNFVKTQKKKIEKGKKIPPPPPPPPLSSQNPKVKN